MTHFCSHDEGIEHEYSVPEKELTDAIKRLNDDNDYYRADGEEV